MFQVIIIVIAGLILLIVLQVILGSRRGLSIAKHLHMFGLVYKKDFEQTGSKEVALVNAFRVFLTCPRLKTMSSSEVNAAVEVLMKAPDPAHLIEKIIMTLDSKKILQAFRDTKFLKELVDSVGRSQEISEK